MDVEGAYARTLAPRAVTGSRSALSVSWVAFWTTGSVATSSGEGKEKEAMPPEVEREETGCAYSTPSLPVGVAAESHTLRCGVRHRLTAPIPPEP